MKVSVITICFNSEKTIRQTIESVLNQTYPNIEYILVDGLSTDKTLEIAKEYVEQFQNKGYEYRIVSEKDKGIYDAMNKGIGLASGEVIGIINSDDWYERIAVETAVDTYKKQSFDLFYADVNIIKPGGRVVRKQSKQDRFPTSRHWNHPTTFVAKRIYEELGTFRNEGIHDDFDFILRVRRANKKIVIKNVVLANFRIGGASNDRAFHKCVKRCKDRYRCYRNNQYSRLYFFECLAMEMAKFVLA